MFDLDEFSEAERLLWNAVPWGYAVELAGDMPTSARTVRGALAAALLSGVREAESGRQPALRLTGAHVRGGLCLCGGSTTYPLSLKDCDFDAPLCMVDLTSGSISLIGCSAPTLDLGGLSATGRLVIDHGEVPGGVRLIGARIDGAVSVRGTRLGADAEGVALLADHLVAEGPLDLRGLRAAGTIALRGARVNGSVDLDDAEIESADRTAVTLDRSTLQGRLSARRLVAGGQVKLRNATVEGSVQMAGAELRNPGGVAFGCGGLIARGGMWLDAGFTAQGEVRLVGAELRANLVLSGALLSGARGTALDLRRASAGEVDCTGLVVRDGPVAMVGGRLGGRLLLGGARLAGDLDLRSVHVDELDLRPLAVAGDVRLNHARIGVLRDNPARWPDRLRLDGLTYHTLAPALPASVRLGWLARDPDPLQSQPYEQLADLYRRSGLPVQARRVLHAMERRQSREKPRAARLWCELQDVIVAYGYQPWRALLWLAVLIGLGTGIYASAPPTPLKRGEAPHFNPLAYTVDLLLPVVDLGQEHAFNPDGVTQWFSYILVAAGWVLVSTVAAGVARTVTK